MRVALTLLVIAACTESGQDRLDDLLDKTTSVCAYSQTDVVPATTVACMNDALVDGGRAQASSLGQDDRGFYVRTYMFTVDHEVHVFESYPSGSESNDEPHAYEKPTCAGPVRGDSTGSPDAVRLVVDGCP